MDKILPIVCFALALGISIFWFPEGFAAVMVATVLSSAVIILIYNTVPEEKHFLTKIFLIALISRIVFAVVINAFNLQNFFGGDALTYDVFGDELRKMWFSLPGRETSDLILQNRVNGVGWGMFYLIAGLYSIIGRNILAAYFFCAVIGAAISPLVYICAYKIFNNRRVGKVSAILAAVSPSFIIWTGQLMKDGIIIFFLVLAMVTVLNLQKKFSYLSLILLVISLFGIISLRFYIFYMAAAAVVGTFVIGFSNTPQAILRRAVVLVLLGVGLTYLGVLRYAGSEFEKFGNLERIQNARMDLSNRAESGFGEDLDVSTTEGAIQTIPIGFAYLMLAPFPWEMTNLRQLITLPDMLIWWACIPFLISGLLFSLKNHLRTSMGILIFALMLSLAYSIFQGNVGTAYRQRTQIQVFLFIFAGVGWTLFLERKENEKLKRVARRKLIEQRLQKKREETFAEIKN